MPRPSPVRAARTAAAPPRTRSAVGAALDSPVLWRALALLAWALMVLVVFLAARWVHDAVTSARDAPCAIEWAALPGWLQEPQSRWVLGEIEAALGPPEAHRRFDPALVHRLGERLAASPWVAAVERIQKTAAGIIQIDAKFREPEALVEVGGRLYLTDGEGTRLPPEYQADVLDHYPDARERLFVIAGVSRPLPPVGANWEAEDLRAGLSLARFLKLAVARREVPFRSSLRAIDVSNFDGSKNRLDGKLRIKTIHAGAYIDWGLPPGEEFGVEASAERKLGNLRTAYVNLGGQLPPKVIVARWPSGIDFREVREPPAPAPPKPANPRGAKSGGADPREEPAKRRESGRRKRP